MNVLVPGSFVNLTPSHFSMLNNVISVLGNQFNTNIMIHIFLIPHHPHNQQDTIEMLRCIPMITDVHIGKERKISCSFLNSHHVSCIIIFKNNFIEIEEKLPVIKQSKISGASSPFILLYSEEHPDIISSSFLFEHRFSPSEFSKEPVPRELIDSAIISANRAPSAGNLQAYKLVLVLKRDTISKVAEACHQDRVLTAHGLFIVLEDPDASSAKYRSRGASKYAQQDAAIACSHLQLALESFGITSRWIGAFKDDQIKSIIKTSYPVCGVLIFGYPCLKERKSKRRNINDYLTVIE